jgi:hypothetical protein
VVRQKESTLPDIVGEEPGTSKDRDDFRLPWSEPIDDAIRAQQNLANHWIGALGHDAARLGKRPQSLDSADEPSHNEFRVPVRVLRDECSDGLKVS